MSEREEALRLARKIAEHPIGTPFRYDGPSSYVNLARALLDCESEKVFAWDVRNDWERSCYAERERAEAAERDLATAREAQFRANVKVSELELDLAAAREVLAFYAARSRYHSECCGACINEDGGYRARAALRSQEAGDA